MEKASWDETFMTLCYVTARRSGDMSTKVGAVIVGSDNSIVSTGYNDLPRGIDDEGEIGVDGIPSHRSPINNEKYLWTEHSERNAIYNAGRNGVPIKGCKLYVNFLPCTPCARAIIQSSIVEVIAHLEGQEAYYEAKGEQPNMWEQEHKETMRMFAKAGIKFRWWSGQLLKPVGFYSGQVIEL